MSREHGLGWRTAVRGLVTVVATGSRREHPVEGWRFVRVVMTAGFMAWCLLSAVHPPAPEVERPLGMALAAGAAVPVVLAEISPLWAWRIIIAMAIASPWVYPTLTNQFGYPWTPSLGGAALVVLYRVGLGHSRIVLLWVFVLTTGVAVALPLRAAEHGLVMSAGIAVSLILGHIVQLWHRAERDRVEQRRRHAQQEALAVTLAERGVIARELHDVVAHHMSVLAVRSDSARYRFPDLSDELREEFAEMHATARDGLVEMRRLLRVLRSSTTPAGAAPQPSAEEISELVKRIRDSGTDVVLHQSIHLEELPTGVALSTYRIVQEALSNVVQHAPGAAVHVEITSGEGELQIAVRNGEAVLANSTETDDTAHGHGLIGMRERAEMLGGTLEAGPDGAGGFAVTATLPIEGLAPANGRETTTPWSARAY